MCRFRAVVLTRRLCLAIAPHLRQLNSSPAYIDDSGTWVQRGARWGRFVPLFAAGSIAHRIVGRDDAIKPGHSRAARGSLFVRANPYSGVGDS